MTHAFFEAPDELLHPTVWAGVQNSPPHEAVDGLRHLAATVARHPTPSTQKKCVMKTERMTMV